MKATTLQAALSVRPQLELYYAGLNMNSADGLLSHRLHACDFSLHDPSDLFSVLPRGLFTKLNRMLLTVQRRGKRCRRQFTSKQRVLIDAA